MSLRLCYSKDRGWWLREVAAIDAMVENIPDNYDFSRELRDAARHYRKHGERGPLQKGRKCDYHSHERMGISPGV